MEPNGKFRGVADFTFPDCQDVPSDVLQLLGRLPIPFNIPVKLCSPEFCVGCGPTASRAMVPVPEAAVNEYDFPHARKGQIRLSREIRSVQPKAVAHTVHQPANDHLRPRIAGADP
jgi:hypothetical protein